MFRRLVEMFAYRRGFRRGYRSGLRKSKAAAWAARVELLADAHDAAARTVVAAHSEAVAIRTANAEAGHSEGYEKGRELGKRSGHSDCAKPTFN